MKQLALILGALALGGGAVYLYQRRRAPAPAATSSGFGDVFGSVFGLVRQGANLLEPFWGTSATSESGSPGGATNRSASSFDTAAIDLDDYAPTTMTVAPGLYTTV